MAHTLRIALAVAAVGLVLAAPAGANSYAVSGTQTVVDLDAGTYKMHGGLLGDWTVTAFKELAKSPLYRARGRERFEGCPDGQQHVRPRVAVGNGEDVERVDAFPVERELVMDAGEQDRQLLRTQGCLARRLLGAGHPVSVRSRAA
jgi:hypothetical protein